MRKKGSLGVETSKGRAEKSRRAAMSSCSEDRKPPAQEGPLSSYRNFLHLGALSLKQREVALRYAGLDSQATQVLCKDTVFYKHTVTVP